MRGTQPRSEPGFVLGTPKASLTKPPHTKPPHTKPPRPGRPTTVPAPDRDATEPPDATYDCR